MSLLNPKLLLSVHQFTGRKPNCFFQVISHCKYWDSCSCSVTTNSQVYWTWRDLQSIIKTRKRNVQRNTHIFQDWTLLFLETFKKWGENKKKIKPAQITSSLPEAARCLRMLVVFLEHLYTGELKTTFCSHRCPLKRLCPVMVLREGELQTGNRNCGLFFFFFFTS